MGPKPTGSPMCFLENSEHEPNSLYQSCSLETALSFLIHRKPVSIKFHQISTPRQDYEALRLLCQLTSGIGSDRGAFC